METIYALHRVCSFNVAYAQRGRMDVAAFTALPAATAEAGVWSSRHLGLVPATARALKAVERKHSHRPTKRDSTSILLIIFVSNLSINSPS